jgi:hypothetical protein
MFNVSRELHDAVDHQRAGLPLHLHTDLIAARSPHWPVHRRCAAKCQATIAKMVVALVSWTGFLMSLISEYGCDVDFPLTPAVWLIMGICAVLFATQPGVGGRTFSGKSRPQAYSFLDGSTLLGCEKPHAIGAIPPRFGDDDGNIYEGDLRVADRCCGGMSSDASVGTATQEIPALIFLSPDFARGPPAKEEQIDNTLRRLAPQRPAVPSSQMQLPKFPSRSSSMSIRRN